MKLKKEEKEYLKSLVEHPWFAVWERIEEEARNRLWQSILNADLSDEKQLNTIRENQIYVKARADFLNNIKTYKTEIYNPIDNLL